MIKKFKKKDLLMGDSSELCSNCFPIGGDTCLDPRTSFFYIGCEIRAVKFNNFFVAYILNRECGHCKRNDNEELQISYNEFSFV